MWHGRRVERRGWTRWAWLAGAALALVGGCGPDRAYIQAATENQTFRVKVQGLERDLAARERTILELREQVSNLESFAKDRPANLFAPVKVEILGVSGGQDYDGQRGDDGITVHLRPYDADGDAVKAPGRIEIQLIDNSDLSSPRVVGVYTFAKPEELRGLWHGRFWTDHYTVRCPFPEGAALPSSGRLTASASFVDFVTGKTLTAVKELSFSRPAPEERTNGSADDGP